MRKVYLITAKDSKIVYGDSLTIGGVFSTEEEAYGYGIWASDHSFLDKSWEVTEMTVDDPRSNNEYEDYPSAYYEE